MLPIDLFSRPMFALSAATAVCSFAVQGLAFVSLPFYFEDVLRPFAGRDRILHDAVAAGGRHHGADRAAGCPTVMPSGCSAASACVLLGIGMVLLAMLPANPGIADIIWRMVICGMGFGFFQAPNMKAVMSSAPPHRSGSARGIVATARLTGQTDGRGARRALLRAGRSRRRNVALALGAGFAALGSVMSFLRLAVK